MDFTREPLVETVITPREGFKLIIRITNGTSQEEYAVGAVEVVSFGNCCCFRSLEKPQAFLLPMTAYEVIESREMRTVLKKPQIDKSIKICGGQKLIAKKEKESEETPKEERKKQEKKRTHKRSSSRKEKETPIKKIEEEILQQRRILLPPPTSLISDQIDRYKNYLVEQGALFPEGAEQGGDKIEDVPAVENDTVSSEEMSPGAKVIDINEES